MRILLQSSASVYMKGRKGCRARKQRGEQGGAAMDRFPAVVVDNWLWRRADGMAVRTLLTAVWLLAGLLVNPGEGHVALTFPPARPIRLDFLDSVRTKPPCGVPKGNINLNK